MGSCVDPYALVIHRGMVSMASMSVSKTEGPGSIPGAPANVFADEFGGTDGAVRMALVEKGQKHL